MSSRSHFGYPLLCCILLVHIAAWFTLRPALPHSDDLYYYQYANKLLSGQFHFSFNHFENRVGLYAPAALFIWLFGSGANIISLWPLIVSLLTISITFFFFRKYSETSIALCASFLLAINILQVTYACALYPDLITAFYCIAIICLVFIGRTRINFTYPVLINVLLLLATLTKETFILIFPFITFILIQDVRKKQHLFFWKRTIAMLIIPVAGFFLFYLLATGDALHWFRSMQFFSRNEYLPVIDEQIQNKSMSNILLWLNNEPALLFILLLAAPGLYNLKNMDNIRAYMLLYGLFLFSEFVILFYIPHYGMAFRLDRYWIFIIAPLSISVALNMKEWTRKKTLVTGSILLCLTLFNAIEYSGKRAGLFALFTAAFAAIYFIEKKTWRQLILLLPFVILLGYFLYSNSGWR